VLSQRLVRRICTNCKESYQPTQKEQDYLKESNLGLLYRGKGCEVCGGAGYLGRTLVYELLTIDDELSRLIDQKADMSEFAEKAKMENFVDIFDITVRKVKEGTTTVAEAMRVLGNIRRS
jgi:type II secretory ATPase GspE/PulE/Tfp pilus assembly ATPase PilB-like protein